MTFAELFEQAMAKVDVTKKYEGRTAAIDALVYGPLREMWDELIKQSKWESGHTSNPYGKADPSLQLRAHGVYRDLSFKVKLKKNGTQYSYWSGNTTNYLPVVAYLNNEELMDKDILEYINQLYDNDESIKQNLTAKQKADDIRTQYQPLVDKYKEFVAEFNALPFEARQVLRNSISFYDLDFYKRDDEEVA